MKNRINAIVIFLLFLIPLFTVIYYFEPIKHWIEDVNEKYTVTETGQDSESQQFFNFSRETENFGEYERSDFGNNAKHYGIDYHLAEDTPVKAVTHGTVTRLFDNEFGGKVLQITESNGNYYQWYMHRNDYNVKEGDTVKPGQVIALSGNTGKQTTGPHLHFQRMQGGIGNDYAEDPKNYIEQLPEGERSLYNA